MGLRLVAALTIAITLWARSEAHIRRPIITGCSKACADVPHQACNTQCQVCVERYECHTVDEDCPVCLKETRTLVHSVRHVDKQVFDSGGDPLIHDGLQMNLQSSKLDVRDGRRNLRKARNGVLEAQREAEWAVEERVEDIADLKARKARLRVTQAKVREWKQRNTHKLEKMRQSQELVHGRQVLAENDLKKAETALQKFEERQGKHKNHDDAEDTEWKLRREVERRKLADRRAQAKQRKLLSDSEWLDRNLQKEVKDVQQAVGRGREELRQARAMEKMTRHRLEGAKDIYRGAAKESQTLGQKAAALEAKLEDHPLPTDLPPNLSEEARTARCSPYCSGSAPVPRCPWIVIIAAVVAASFADLRIQVA